MKRAGSKTGELEKERNEEARKGRVENKWAKEKETEN